MSDEKKLTLLEEMLDLDEGSLKAEMALEDIEEYDSMAKLSLIVLFEDEFEKKITAKDVRNFKTVKDILDFMN